jgi:MFS transporter, FHS family, L-fucose permease
LGVSLNQAKLFPSYVLFLTITGYLTGIVLIPKVASQLITFKLFALFGLILSFLIIYTHGKIQLLGISIDISIWFIVLLGLANSLVWAGIWPLAINGLGQLTKVGSSLMIMGLCGNAIMPLVYGYFADKFDQQSAYWVLVPCYIYIVFYAFKGHKYKNWEKNKN